VTQDAFVLRLLDTPEVQRLRRIRALGPASLAFPGAEHSRFAHALGAAHVMSRYLGRVAELAQELPPCERIDEVTAKIALAAALLHDLGHGPYSHTFEEALIGARAHETWTSKIVLHPDTAVHRIVAELGSHAPKAVERLIRGEHPILHLARAVSGTFDVDRCDYLLRDSYQTGVRYGLLDLDWLFASLRLHVPRSGEPARLAVDGEKGLTAVEGFFLARLYMYRQVYLHKAVRAAECMIYALVRRLCALGPRPCTHPVMAKILRREAVSVDEYLLLDDSIFDGEISAYTCDADPILRELATGLRERRLFKTMALRPDVDLETVGDALRTALRQGGYDPEFMGSIDRVETAAFVEDDALCVLGANGRVQPLLAASPVLRGLSRERYVQVRAVFTASARPLVEDALREWT
jgi:HD superfamily phosphohydrolase